MKYLLMMLVLIAVTQVTATGVYDVIESLAERAEEASTSSEVEVVELFHAQSPEELEAALTDGYPMPWLEEILNDESIPEEDRYWLDCRVRALIAQDLHLFFNEDGDPVHIEADWIGPGEDYWREHMMVNPSDETEVPEEEPPDTFLVGEDIYLVDLSPNNNETEAPDENRPTPRVAGEPGYILDLYGNRVGELATVHSFVSLSRDASIAAIQSGSTPAGGIALPWASFACFMYPDGSFREISFDRKGYYEEVISANGKVIAFLCTSPSGMHDPQTFERTDVTGEVYFYDTDGNLIHSVSPPVLLFGGKISAYGRFFCGNLCTGDVFLVNCAQNYSTSLFTDRSNFNFNPNGNYLCLGGHSSGLVIDLDTFEAMWEADARIGQYDYVRVNCSNNAECIASTTRHGHNPDYYYELEVFLYNELVYTEVFEGFHRGITIMSPNGHFLLSCMQDLQVRDSSMQTIIKQVKREGSE
ncbi:MAG: hypothetical protein K8R76_06615 [Candidatus Aegiribacteria sp.]|nr:hypothetical protein [Candidatus Aegiribacteria sp.]